ncbi:hypothetical protein HDU83_009173 [Entophlyctis luteolus]|nr:hypothetical protein HDU83_009173 [Entophlyctis luteolus]
MAASLLFLLALALAALGRTVTDGGIEDTSLSIAVNMTLVDTQFSGPVPPAARYVRPILDTGSPPPAGATGAAIWRGQSAAVRFTAPSDVPPYGARLVELRLVLRASPYSNAAVRLSVVQDSGANTPGGVVLETRAVTIPAYNGRVTVTAGTTASVYLWPGELFWAVVECTATSVSTGVSWLDSVNGVAWTAFSAWPAVAPADGHRRAQIPIPAEAPHKSANPTDYAQDLSSSDDAFVSAAGWVVERSTSASVLRVLVD